MSDQQQLPARQTFAQELEEYTPNLVQALPPTVSVDKFKRILMTAVSMNPDLYHANRRTFFNSAVRCAADGLMPDGREAALVVYNTKVKQRDQRGIDREVTIAAVTYLPMIAGIRKRMRNSGDVLSAVAEVVYSGDQFRYKLGDDAMIQHEPPPLGVERGRPVGAYAIIRLKSGEVLRDVLTLQEIEAARRQGRANNSLMWTKFWDEGAKKTALRRCAKSAPQSAEVEALLAREEEPPLLGHDHHAMPALEPPPERSDYTERVEEAGGYEVVDTDGAVHIFVSEQLAVEALQRVLQEAARLGRDRLIGAWDDNSAVVEELGRIGADDGDLADTYTSLLDYFQKPASPQPAAERPRPAAAAPAPPVEGVEQRRVPRDLPPTTGRPPAQPDMTLAPTAAYDATMDAGGQPSGDGPGPTATTGASPSDDGFHLTAPPQPAAQGTRSLRMVYDRDNRPNYRTWVMAVVIPAMRKITISDDLAWFFADNDEELERACREPELRREVDAAKAAQWEAVRRVEAGQI